MFDNKYWIIAIFIVILPHLIIDGCVLSILWDGAEVFSIEFSMHFGGKNYNSLLFGIFNKCIQVWMEILNNWNLFTFFCISSSTLSTFFLWKCEYLYISDYFHLTLDLKVRSIKFVLLHYFVNYFPFYGVK